MKNSNLLPLVSVFLTSISATVIAEGATISIPDGGNFSNIQEDTRASGFARSIGQTFIIPSPTSENILTSFSFYVDAGSSPVDVDLAAYVYRFDTASTSPTGSALFSSGALSVNSDGPLTFNPGISLNPAFTYIAFLSTSGLQDEDNNPANIESDQTGPYADGGGFRYTGILTDTSSFTGDAGNWNAVSPDWDYRFDATFVVPEPTSSFLLAMGAMGFLTRRRRS